MFRFINQRSMSKIKALDHPRVEERIDMNVGVWAAPLVKRRPVVEGAFRALTKNFTSTGIGLFVDHELDCEQLLVRLVSDSQAIFLQTEVIDATPLGAGFHLVGLKVEDLVQPGDLAQLEQLEQMLAEAGR
jgi:hypothetical protein